MMRVILIPADPDQPITETDIGRGWEGIASAIPSATYVERVTTPMLHLLAGTADRYPSVSMWIDEDGLGKQLPHNQRASLFYPYGQGIVGDAVLVGEDFVSEGVDATSLPATVTVDSVRAAIGGSPVT